MVVGCFVGVWSREVLIVVFFFRGRKFSCVVRGELRGVGF